MRKPALFVALALLIAATSAAAKPGVDFFRKGVPHKLVPGVGLVKLRGIDAHQLVTTRGNEGVLKGLAGRTGVDIELIRPVALGWAFVELRAHGDATIPSEDDTLRLLQRLAKDSAVEAVTEDKWMRALRVPNDPGLQQMWHFDIIHAQQAWDITQGTSNQRIGIVDTGLVRSHEDVGNRATGGFDFISNPGTGNDGDGRDADFNDAGDSCGGPASFHGTHVAGTIGATADNGTGVVGLNWNAGLVIARALGVCGGDLVDIGEGAIWLAGGHIDNVPDAGANKVSVMNLSLGSDGACSQFEQQAVDFVNQQGAVFVAAAGNSGQQLGQSNSVGSPANCNGAVAVGAHGPQHELASYSSFGGEVAIVGPGGDEEQFGQAGGVLSSIGPTGTGYAFEEGTSMATPHIAGAISLMQAVNPALTRAQIVSILQSTGVACTGCGSKKAIVLDAALAAVPPGGTVTPPPPPPPPAGDDALEENDSFDQAVSGVDCNTTQTLVALPADQDWFLVPTVAGEGIDITIASTNGADLDLYALTGPTQADIVASSETTTGNESIHIDGDGTTFHVLVNPFVDTTNNVQNTGSYNITMACTGATPPPGGGTTPPGGGTTPPGGGTVDPGALGPNPNAIEDSAEDNDTLPQAAEMFCDQVQTYTAKDDDFFKLDVRDGDTLEAQITSNGLALATQILSPSGDVIAEGTDTTPASAASLPAGTYVLKVSPQGTFGVYQLKPACLASAVQSTQIKAAGGCSSTGASAAPVGLALLALLLRRRRR